MNKLHYQILWVVGAFERLSSLGFIEEPPYAVTADSVELFVELDDQRDILVTDDEIRKIVPTLIQETSDSLVSKDTVDCLIHLILEYKNNRTEIVKQALNNSFN